MKKFIVALSFLVITFMISIMIFPSAILASGTTGSATGSGQVTTNNRDGVLYLTTSTNTSTSSASSSGKTNSILAKLIGEGIFPPTGFASNLGGLINSLLTLVMTIAALLVFFYLIWGAMQWITSGGDKGKTEDARNKIVHAIIGLIILSASFAVFLVVIRFLGFSSFNDIFSEVRVIS